MNSLSEGARSSSVSAEAQSTDGAAKKHTGSSNSTPNNNISKDEVAKSLNNRLHRVPSREWEISIYQVKFTKRLGQGASATTYLGQWTGQNVAIKVASVTEFGQDGWRTEVNALQRLHHPNIIRMMATIYNENPQTQ